MLDRTVVDDWNKLRAFFAEQYIYAHVNRPELLELAAKFKGYGPPSQGGATAQQNSARLLCRAVGKTSDVPLRWAIRLMSGWPTRFRVGFP